MASMKGKVIAITGGASGIGFALAKLLASREAIVYIADLQETALKAASETISETGGAVKTKVLDVRKREQVEGWLDEIIADHGKLDGAANIAGVFFKGKPSEIKDYDDEQWEFVMGINCTGVFNCLRAQLSRMGSGGTIVNAASVSGQHGSPAFAAYSASKHAVISLTRTAAKEAGSSNIRVNAVAPGFIDTPMTQALSKERLTPENVALKRVAEPEEVAKFISFLLSDESSYITGAILNVDGGWMC